MEASLPSLSPEQRLTGDLSQLFSEDEWQVAARGDKLVTLRTKSLELDGHTVKLEQYYSDELEDWRNVIEVSRTGSDGIHTMHSWVRDAIGMGPEAGRIFEVLQRLKVEGLETDEAG